MARERKFVDAIPALLLDDGRVLDGNRATTSEARDTFDEALASEGATETAELLDRAGPASHARLGRCRSARASGSPGRSALPEAIGGRHACRDCRRPRGEVAYAAGRHEAGATRRSTRPRACGPTICPTPRASKRARYVGLLDGLAGRAAGRARDRRPACSRRAHEAAVPRSAGARVSRPARSAGAAAERGRRGARRRRMERASAPNCRRRCTTGAARRAAALGTRPTAAARPRGGADACSAGLQQAVPEALRAAFSVTTGHSGAQPSDGAPAAGARVRRTHGIRRGCRQRERALDRRARRRGRHAGGAVAETRAAVVTRRSGHDVHVEKTAAAATRCRSTDVGTRKGHSGHYRVTLRYERMQDAQAAAAQVQRCRCAKTACTSSCSTCRSSTARTRTIRRRRKSASTGRPPRGGRSSHGDEEGSWDTGNSSATRACTGRWCTKTNAGVKQRRCGAVTRSGSRTLAPRTDKNAALAAEERPAKTCS